jgi:protease-4
MRVLRFIRRIVFGLFAIVGGFIVLGTLASVIAWRYFPSVEHRVPDQVVLTLDLADGIGERGGAGPLAWTSFGNLLTVRDLVLGLDAAGRDPRVKGLVARLGGGDLGMARAQEIRDAVLAFRQHGKFALAFAESFGEAGDGNTHYYLATAFDEIWLQPSGDVGLTGVRLESPYVKAALDSLGVIARIDQREEYKGAMDPLTSASMPQPVRENFQRLVDSWVGQIAAGIADGRKMDAAAARALIDRGPFLADEAQKERLVDRLGYWDEVGKAVGDRFGQDVARMSVANYAGSLVPPSDAPRIALVYGLGPVQLSGGRPDPLFGEISMGSQAVSGALHDAVEDASVRAIIFRVDSPGGSYVASDTIWREVERARDKGKPVIVSMGDVAASGGYFVAAAARKIVAQPGTITGSIGVVSGKVVLTDLWTKLNVAWDGVQAGANADVESTNRDYSAAGWSQLQRALDHVYADFMGKVAAGRNMPADRVHAVAKGQVWTGEDAKANGLVDALGGFAAALKLARESIGLAADAEVRLVEFPPPENRLEAIVRRMLDTGATDAKATREAVTLARLARFLEPAARVLTSATDGTDAHNLQLPELHRNQ